MSPAAITPATVERRAAVLRFVIAHPHCTTEAVRQSMGTEHRFAVRDLLALMNDGRLSRQSSSGFGEVGSHWHPTADALKPAPKKPASPAALARRRRDAAAH